eukprot:265971_1
MAKAEYNFNKDLTQSVVGESIHIEGLEQISNSNNNTNNNYTFVFNGIQNTNDILQIINPHIQSAPNVKISTNNMPSTNNNQTNQCTTTNNKRKYESQQSKPPKKRRKLSPKSTSNENMTFIDNTKSIEQMNVNIKKRKRNKIKKNVDIDKEMEKKRNKIKTCYKEQIDVIVDDGKVWFKLNIDNSKHQFYSYAERALERSVKRKQRDLRKYNRRTNDGVCCLVNNCNLKFKGKYDMSNWIHHYNDCHA